MDALAAHRLQFAFTITYHYLFPQLTMGLAVLIAWLAIRGARGDAASTRAARFWLKIFGLTFVAGVVTGIPMEMQFGTNWARFSETTGSVIGQTLAMEGMIAFFLESTFLYLLLFEERRLGPKGWATVACLVAGGTWLSGYFIVTTNAFMQHPVGHAVTPEGDIILADLGAYLTNPWAFIAYAHTMVGALITGSFTMAGVGALYRLLGAHDELAGISLRLGTRVGLVAACMAAMPTGDLQAKAVAEHQPATFAAMEGHFHPEEGGTGLVILGQPNMETLHVDNPIVVPNALSILTHQRWDTEITSLSEIPREEWPEHIPLLYYAYHVMAGLGTLFIALMGLSALLAWRGRLDRTRPMLWALVLAVPLPFIANTAGWMTAELGRQPWLVHGLLRTADGTSEHVSGGNVLFTLIGFMGLYALLSVALVLFYARILREGPEAPPASADGGADGARHAVAAAATRQTAEEAHR